MNKIQVGYGSDRRGSKAKGIYGKKRSGKILHNGGFSGEPTVDFTKISDERWASIFGNKSLPKWKQELLKKDGKI